MHARLLVLALAPLSCAAVFAACGLQTSGLALGGSSSGSAGGTASHTTSATGGAGGSADAGEHDAAEPDAAEPDAAEPDASADAGHDAAPVDAGPTYYASCKALLAAEPGATSDVYTLVDGAKNTYQAYCDMGGGDAGDGGNGGAGGGWTLVLKISGGAMTFQYSSVLWTNTDAYNATMPALDTNEAKLPSYWSVPFTEVRLGMIDPNDHATRWLVVPLAGSSLLDLLDADGGGATTLGNSSWEGLLANGSIQTNCNWQGINADGHVRIGLVGDESSPQCTTPDSFLGFGADTSFQGPEIACGNIAHYSPDHGDQNTPAFGYVMVR